MPGEEFRRAREKAYRLLACRPRSTAEIFCRLQRCGFAEPVIQEVLSFLQEYGLVDDRAFARDWVNWRLSANPRGREGLFRELRARGVSREVIAETLEELDDEKEYATALSLAQKKVGREGAAYPRHKLAAFLRRRGFSPEIIYRVCQSLSVGNCLDI